MKANGSIPWNRNRFAKRLRNVKAACIYLFSNMFRLTFILTLLLLFASAGPLFAEAGGEVAATAWWIWPLALFGITFAIGILAVLGGVGGGVLFVPIISGFFPFHIDFVRASGLLVALCGALAAGPGLLKHRLASLRLAMPLALITSSFAIVGAWIGLGLPASIVQTALGITILCISGIMLRFKPGSQNGVRNSSWLTRSCGRLRRWRPSGSLPGVSPTTSTT